MIGLGGVGQRHLRNLRTILGDTAMIAAYRVRRNALVLTDQLKEEHGSSLEDKYNISVFDNLDDALAWGPQIAIVCNPSSLHIPTALAVARAGCHLLIEKPLSISLDGVDLLNNIVEEKKLVALVAYQLRFHPCLRRAHTLLQENCIGKVIAVRSEVGEYLPDWHTYEDYRTMYASRKELGGGVVLSQIHEMDYLYWFFGLPQRVFALGGHLSSLEIDVEDTASILMDCGGVPVHVHQDYVQRPGRRNLQIIGDAGKILVDLRTSSIEVFNQAGQLCEEQAWSGFQRNQLFIDELNHFLACVAGQEKPMVSLRDGAQSLRMALAAKKSMTTGDVVRLGEDK